jgi:MFS family permease
MQAPGAEGRDRTALTVALAVVGVFVTYFPITAVSIALTTIGQDTGASTSDLQWVSDAYIIPMAATILSAGVFGESTSSASP